MKYIKMTKELFILVFTLMLVAVLGILITGVKAVIELIQILHIALVEDMMVVSQRALLFKVLVVVEPMVVVEMYLVLLQVVMVVPDNLRI